MFKKLRDFGFTKQDIIILLFLLCSFSAGIVIKYSGWKPAHEFDYSAADKEFEQNVKSAFSSLDAKGLAPEKQQLVNKINIVRDSLDEETKKQSLSPKETLLNRKININTAPADELAMLPGIGKQMADRIIEYRAKNHGFKNIDELMDVKGIGDKKYAKLKNYVVVE